MKILVSSYFSYFSYFTDRQHENINESGRSHMVTEIASAIKLGKIAYFGVPSGKKLTQVKLPKL
jgi:hypothetical protein